MKYLRREPGFYRRLFLLALPLILQNLITKLSYLGIKGGLGELKRMMDSEEVGGAPLLGVQGAVVKAHGSSDGHAIACAIGQCVKMIDGRVVELISANLAGILPKE